MVRALNEIKSSGGPPRPGGRPGPAPAGSKPSEEDVAIMQMLMARKDRLQGSPPEPCNIPGSFGQPSEEDVAIMEMLKQRSG